MSKRIKGSRWLAAALLAGMVGVGGSALTSPAYAEDNQPEPAKAECKYEGKSYSDGSVRSQDVKYPDGSTETKYYECSNGSWKKTGTPAWVHRQQGPARRGSGSVYG